MQVLKFGVSILLAVAALTLIGYSFEKYLSKRRTTLQHEEPLGPFTYPIISVCGVVEEEPFINESQHIVGKAEHWILNEDSRFGTCFSSYLSFEPMCILSPTTESLMSRMFQLLFFPRS